VVPEILGKSLRKFEDGEIKTKCPEAVVNIALLTKIYFSKISLSRFTS
jgi:hypothetical protein